MSAIARYTEGELEGKDIERESNCSRCGGAFTQSRLAADWLNTMADEAPAHLELLLKTCQVEVNPDNGKRQVWTPARCATCTRATLNPQLDAPSSANSHLRIVP